MKENKLVPSETEGAGLLQGASLLREAVEFPWGNPEIECGQPLMGSLHSYADVRDKED